MLLFIIMYLFPQEVSHVQHLVQHLVKSTTERAGEEGRNCSYCCPQLKTSHIRLYDYTIDIDAHITYRY